MATRKTTRTTSTSKSHYNEIVAIILYAIGVLMLLCLISSDPMDVSLNTSTTTETQNWIGIVGSAVADILFQSFGLMAYALPALLFVIGTRFLFSKTLYTPPARILGVLLFVLTGTSLLSLFGFYGGITGAFFTDISTALLNTIGTGILFFALFLASIILITNFSYTSLFESFDIAWTNFKIRFGEWSSKYRSMKAEHEQEITLNNNSVKKIAKPNILDVKAKTETAKEKTKISDKFSSIIDKLAEPPESVGEEKPVILNKDIVSEKADQKASDPVLEKPIEKVKAASANMTPTPTGKLDIIGEATKIPIRPIQQTGELDTEVKEKTEEKIAPKELQNYDDYILPMSEFLNPPPPRIEQKDEELFAIAENLTQKTKEFNVTGKVVNIGQGPVVTTYEFKPDPGVKYSRVTGLVDDLCLALKAESIRIERIPGKAFVGIEVPNRDRETIFLRDVVESEKFKNLESPLAIALGKRIDGHREVTDLAKMPHLLIAGATGAGKSVGVNSLIVSILYKAKPDEVKFIMVDPKRLELGVYADIPHLATPIITDPKRASISLKWAVGEMERRYKELAGWGVRNIAGFNKEVIRKNSIASYDEDGNPHQKLPYIVIIIDELADLMMVSGKEVEESITRLAQMARAVGIHLVLATQRPSVDVITGLIKANFPARISFRVSSKIDSRTIIDANGAERLLGKGDMLFLPPATSQLIRVHGAYVDEKEIQKIVEHIKRQGNPDYDETITKSEEEMDDFGDLPGRKDKLFGEALKTVVGSKRASTSLLQRHLRIGYGRAAAILDALVADGFIGDMDGSKRARPVTQKAYEAVQEMEEGREL
jgi:S-DNA-T family DNA segregation ATPase FtsK/SpoIIIE